MSTTSLTIYFLFGVSVAVTTVAKPASYCASHVPLNWSQDPWLPLDNPLNSTDRLSLPSLTQPFYNTVNDVRATVSANGVNLILSTNGNWRSALALLLNNVYFSKSPSVPTNLTSTDTRESYLLTTSPPISPAQLLSGLVKVGNVMYVDAQPHLVVAPSRVLNVLRDAELTDDATRTPIIRTFGNVVLKRRGYQRVRCFWDLRKVKPGRFASSDPAEGGSYNNYRDSVLNIALANPRRPGDANSTRVQAEAQALQYELFDRAGVATIGPPMHNSVPHVIANKEADAGLLFLHLAVTAMRNNPGVFSAVYLDKGGHAETSDPDVLAAGQEPLEGNRVGNFAFVESKVGVTNKQTEARAAFERALLSQQFTDILQATGLRRPEGF